MCRSAGGRRLMTPACALCGGAASPIWGNLFSLLGGENARGDLADLLREGGDDLRVELRACTAGELGQRVARREAAAVHAVGRHRVERVGDEDGPGAERNCRAGESAGVPGAVPALV